MTQMLYFLRVALLLTGFRHEAPWLDDEAARQNVCAAVAAETVDVPAEVILALAWRESRYDPNAGPMCGVTQVTLHGRPCRGLVADGLEAQYAAGVSDIERHFRTCRRMGRPTLKCALNSFAEGPAAGRRGWGVKGCGKTKHCDRSASVLGRARRIVEWGRHHASTRNQV